MYVDADGIRRLGMLSAGHQAKSEPGFIEDDVRRRQKKDCDDHEPAHFKLAGLQKDEGLLLLDILDGGGHIMGIFRSVHRFDKDCRRSGAEQVHRSPHQRLVRLEPDSCHCQKQGIEHTADNTAEQHGDQHGKGRQIREKLHYKRASQRSHDHDPLQSEIDHTTVFGEASAQCHKKKYGRIDQSILYQ